MNGATAFRDVIHNYLPATRLPSRLLFNAWETAEKLGVSIDWVVAHRHLLPCFDVPSDDGIESLARMRVRIEDLPLWKTALRETR